MATTLDKKTSISSLRSQFPSDVIGLPAEQIELSWQVSSDHVDAVQLGFEIESAADLNFINFVITTRQIGDQSQWVKCAGSPANSRETRFFRVRIETQYGWTDWSLPLVHETGLVEASHMVGVAIGDENLADGPAALLRTVFETKKKIKHARLYATAHGVFDILLNGKKVGNQVLAPGWTPYQHRILVETYDVTDQLFTGKNALGALLADGWYRGKFGFVGLYNNYGEHTSFLCQLEIVYEDGTVEVVATDENWKTATGGVRTSSIYDGCTIDMTLAQKNWCTPDFDDSNWSAVTVREFDKSVLSPRTAPPVRVKQEFKMAITEQGNRVLLDAGQNIAGWIRLVVSGKRGDVVTVRHAEVLEPDGELHTAALRSAMATDVYTLGHDGENVFEPKLTFHGFQFADVDGPVEVIAATAIAITSDTPDRGNFESSHQLLNRLHSNVVWSLRDNFVSIPTDCPQRDERLGWTGDAQAFIGAANTLVDGNSFFRSWLKDVALEQQADGKISMVVPDLLSIQNKVIPSSFPSHGHAGWGDAATIIPWAQYQSFGDLEVLRTQLQSMRGWVDYFENLRGGEPVFPDLMQLGDWLDPDAPEGQPWAAKVSGRFVASAYSAHSARLLSQAEALVGTSQNAEKYATKAAEITVAAWQELGEAAVQTTTGAALALEFNICPDSARERIAADLAASVRNAEGRISTGFLGTPLILDALSRNGYLAEAYLMLLRTEIRSWLYPVTMGATTIWERWEAIKPDGSIGTGTLENPAEGSEDGMVSFNHYAYGAVIDWVYRNLAGLVPRAPGYAEVSIAPRPVEEIDHVEASINSGYGPFSISWKVSSQQLEATVVIPFGVIARLDLPVSERSNIFVNDLPVANHSQLTHGTHRLLLTQPNIVKHNPEIY
jgi:alpha-L-rhamnosidase